MQNLTEFIIEEYKSAVQLTYHLDSLRNKVTSFYLTFATIVSVVIFIVLENKADSSIFNINLSFSFISFFVSIIGLISVLISVRLRFVQLEHFKIINSIREFQLCQESDVDKRIIIGNVQGLSSNTVHC